LLAEPPANRENVIPVQIEQVIYVGAESHYELRAAEQTLHCEMMNAEGQSSAFPPGRAAWVHLPPKSLILLND